MVSNSSFLIFFRAGRCDLAGVAAALTGARFVVEQRDDELTVSYPGAPIFRVRYSAAETVATEANRIAARHPPAAALLPCDVRFEVQVDDLESALDEMNTLIELQATLVGATGGFGFNSWNREVWVE